MALALTVACFPFVSGSMIAMMIGISIAGVAVNTILRIAVRSLLKRRSENFLEKAFYSSNFYRASGTNAMILIHETGHLSASQLCFGGPASIHIMPYVGGWTSHATKPFTNLGQILGYRRSMFFISLAGPALAILASSIALIAGLMLRDSCPNASPYLIGMGLFEFLNHAQYAYSARSLTPAQVGHDFVRLKGFGINPIAAALTIVAIPIFILMGFLIRDWKQTQSIRLNSDSDRIGTPSFSALASFEPGSEPART